MNNCIIAITYPHWYTIEDTTTQGFKYIYIYILEGFEGLIVPRIFSHQTCHSTNTYFNWKYENYIEKLCE